MGVGEPRAHLGLGLEIRGGRLVRTDRSTHCPLKGDAEYFDLVIREGDVLATEIAWSYPEPPDFASALAGRIAFYADKVTIEESPT